jgi:predicted dehydrogenase
MDDTQKNRREFLKSSLGTVSAAALAASTGAGAQESAGRAPRIRFAAIGLNHGHISGQVEAVRRGGGQLVSFYAKEPELAAAFAKRFPGVKQAGTEREILEDRSIQLVVSAAIPNERAPLGVRVMQHGKDFMSDKPAATTLEQLDEVRRVQRETKRIYSVLIERHEHRATAKAVELVRAGAIGRVLQTLSTGPHRMNPQSRPSWFFERERYGGILCDIASHHIDQFLYLTGSTQAEVVGAQVGNLHHPQHPGLEDYGDVMLRGDRGTAYIRVDWLSPAGLSTYGDGRLTILGTEGYIEVRKTIDLAGRPGGDHLFIVDAKAPRYVDCRDVPLPYAERLVDDVLSRTETANVQTQTFLAMEVALHAQQAARRLTLDAV